MHMTMHLIMTNSQIQKWLDRLRYHESMVYYEHSPWPWFDETEDACAESVHEVLVDELESRGGI